MSFGLNRAEVIGRLGADVTINHLASGERRLYPSCCSIVTHVLATATLRVLRSLRSLRPGPRRSKASRESRRP